ncbi:MAG TPA: O-antigen ligase family protein [Candidatus Competibacteraceae bacterium]|nr:O-antigen ligase family protein [Candidatus Competibacteraceae bacterium]
MNCIESPLFRISGDSIRKLLFFTYSLFLIGFFISRTAPNHCKFYYFAVLPLAIPILPESLRQLNNDTLFRLLALYIAYMAFSAIWSEPFSLRGLRKSIMEGLYVSAFIIITALLCSTYPARFERLLRTLCLVAGIMAIVAMLVWYSQHPFPDSRLPGIGRMQFEIRSACAYGLFAIIAGSHAFRTCGVRAHVGYTLLVIILIFFVILTQSRTALLSVGLGLAILSLTERPRQATISLSLLAGFCSLLLLFYPALWEGLASRGESYRPAIWSVVIDNWLQAPIWGHGYLANTTIHLNTGEEFNEAHSSYLAMLRDGGIIGLSILLTMLGYACWQALRFAKQTGNYILPALLIYSMSCIVPNDDRLLTRPREQWLFLWLPLALILAERLRRKKPTVTPPRPDQEPMADV